MSTRKQAETSIYTKSVILKKARENNIKTRKSKNGIFFYKDLNIENRGYFSVTAYGKTTKEYHTGYKIEGYVSNEDFRKEDAIEYFKRMMNL